MAQRWSPNYLGCIRMEVIRGPGCWKAGTSKESDTTVVDCNRGYTECGHATVVAELADGMSELDAIVSKIWVTHALGGTLGIWRLVVGLYWMLLPPRREMEILGLAAHLVVLGTSVMR
jgi:hypothetical protein